MPLSDLWGWAAQQLTSETESQKLELARVFDYASIFIYGALLVPL